MVFKIDERLTAGNGSEALTELAAHFKLPTPFLGELVASCSV